MIFLKGSKSASESQRALDVLIQADTTMPAITEDITNNSRHRRRDIVAIGASAGGVEAISHLLKYIPPNFRGSVLVVLHRPPERISYLHNILSRTTKMHVMVPRDSDLIKPNFCLVSPPDQHLTVGPGLRVRLLPDAFYRTHNIDALFTSLAQHAGSRAIGIILSGQGRTAPWA